MKKILIILCLFIFAGCSSDNTEVNEPLEETTPEEVEVVKYTIPEEDKISNENYSIYFISSSNLENWDEKGNYDIELVDGLNTLKEITDESKEGETPIYLFIGTNNEINDVKSGLNSSSLLIEDGKLVSQSTLDAQTALDEKMADNKEANTTYKTVTNTVTIDSSTGSSSTSTSSSSSSSGSDLSYYYGLTCSEAADAYLHNNGIAYTLEEVGYLSPSELQYGDRLIYPGHVAIYVGNSQMFEGGVGNNRTARITSLRTDYTSVYR